MLHLLRMSCKWPYDGLWATSTVFASFYSFVNIKILLSKTGVTLMPPIKRQERLMTGKKVILNDLLLCPPYSYSRELGCLDG